MYQVKLKCDNDTCESILVTEIPVICASMYSPVVPQEILQSFGVSCFAANYDKGTKLKVDILVGLDTYWKLVKPRVVSIPRGLVAQETVFG